MGKSESKSKAEAPAAKVRTKKASAKPRKVRGAAASTPLRKAKPSKADRKSGAGNRAGRMKTIRDRFNMPADDYALIAALKKRALDASTRVKKSELLRAGLRVLSTLSDDAFKAALAAISAVKTGRPDA